MKSQMRPIIFSDAMVRAILDGTKTQTRRVVRTLLPASEYEVVMHPGDGPALETFGDPLADEAERRFCPYGVHGDRLWVREAWRCVGLNDDWTRATIELRAGPGGGWTSHDVDPDDPITERTYNHARPYLDADGVLRRDAPWRPSIHMPRWASRITLELTDVRVERVQDISEEDARAEGMEREVLHAETGEHRTARDNFSILWDGINAERAPWVSNPWVWALTFKKVTP